LPGTLEEVQRIAEIAKPIPSISLLTGSEAGVANVRARLPRSRYVHLATHGMFATSELRPSVGIDSLAGRPLPKGRLLVGDRGSVTGRNPLTLSGVVLAGANNPPQTNEWGVPVANDGVLTGEEVADLDLEGTELVVLSACETAAGVGQRKEGIYSIQRAFALAGARSVIASTWKVDDKATQSLMVEFYRNLWEKKLGKLESLRQAQLKMIRDYDPVRGRLRGPGKSVDVPPERLERARREGSTNDSTLPPFFWAAFVLSGDWR
jgi:CHAT domain-containing protein